MKNTKKHDKGTWRTWTRKALGNYCTNLQKIAEKARKLELDALVECSVDAIEAVNRVCMFFDELPADWRPKMPSGPVEFVEGDRVQIKEKQAAKYGDFAELVLNYVDQTSKMARCECNGVHYMVPKSALMKARPERPAEVPETELTSA